MTFLILDIISLVITVFFMIFSGIYNLHMFQQNTYINSEEIVWLKKFNERQRVLLLVFIVGCLSFFDTLKYVRFFYAFISLITLIYYIKIEKIKIKKPLVWTARAKRLFISYMILIILISFLGTYIVIKRDEIIYLVLAILGLFSPLFIVLSNIINYPIEEMIREYYIRDAKNILKRMPDMKIIGITGSYGKTSVKYYLETLLKAKFNVVKTPESFNTPMGIVKTIRSYIKPDTEIFLCEMGARKVGEIKELCDLVHPNDGIITSIGPQHLETFLTMDNIISTKFMLAESVKDKGKIFLNMDCDYIRDNAVKYKNVVSYFSRTDIYEKNSYMSSMGYYATDIKVDENGTVFTLNTPNKETETYRMKLIGAHNVINVVGALAVSHMYGISLKKLKTQVIKLRCAPHRMQIIPRGDITIIDDAYNSNPVGSKAALETLAMFSGTKIIITPGMVELGDKEDFYNKKFGNYIAKYSDYAILIGEKHTRPIYRGLKEKGFDEKKIFVCETLQEAMEYATKINEGLKKFILLENDLTDNY